jgi:predicted Fe-Mo cluster-binding NifX family protein
MKVCFPIAKDKRLASKVFPHFGSAPQFLIVDATDQSTELVQAPEQREHGGCRPVDLLAPHGFDAIVVGGIGPGAIARLTRAGKDVFLSGAPTVEANLELLAEGKLQPCDPHGFCESPGHGRGAGHGPGLPMGCGGHRRRGGMEP